MKKFLYTLLVIAAWLSADVAQAQPKLKVWGYGATLNGQNLSWGLWSPVVVDLVDGKYTLEFALTPAAGTEVMVTNFPDDVAYDSFEPLKEYAMSPYTTALSGKPVEIIKREHVNFLPFTSSELQKYTIVINESCTEATVTNYAWDGKLHVAGAEMNIFKNANGEDQALNWDLNSFAIEPKDGYFTLEGYWSSAANFSLTSSGEDGWNYYNSAAIGPDGYGWSPNNRYVPVEFLNNTKEVCYSAPNLYPPYPGNYVIKIKDDLTTIDIEAAHRKIVLCGTFNNFSTTEGYIEMTTTDGINYTASITTDDNFNEGSQIRISDLSNKAYNWISGTPVEFGKPQGWGWNGDPGTTGTTLPAKFVGNIEVEVPVGTLQDGDLNYWYKDRVASVIFEEDPNTGIDDITVDDDAPVEYYNLQGIRVEDPQAGMYIRRQGLTATKILIK